MARKSNIWDYLELETWLEKDKLVVLLAQLEAKHMDDSAIQ